MFSQNQGRKRAAKGGTMGKGAFKSGGFKSGGGNLRKGSGSGGG